MARPRKFKFSDYDGGFPTYPQPIQRGSFLLRPSGRWEVLFTAGLRNRRFWGGAHRFPLAVSETGAESCRIVITDRDDPAVRASLDLPDTPAAAVNEALMELDEALMELDAAAQRGRELAERAGTGEWWLGKDVFKGFGLAQRYTVNDTRYFGGWSGHARTYSGKVTKILEVDKQGVGLRGLSTIFTIPWSDIADVDVDGPDTAAKKLTASRAILLGPASLLLKKKVLSTVVTVRTKNGEEAVFVSEKANPALVRAKLTPVLSQLHRVAGEDSIADATDGAEEGVDTPEEEPPHDDADFQPGVPVLGVAEELERLAGLRDSGVLTESEFLGQKARLLGR